jgi:hypothetical protein
MVDIGQWVRDLTQKLWDIFGERVEFIGLQGSYARGEATDESDIDLVVVLDHLTAEDLRAYRGAVQTMPEAEKASGFLCGQEELRSWPGYDLFQLYYDTKPLYGCLETFLPVVGKEDAEQAAYFGASQLYHMACHGYLFGDQRQTLKLCYKNAFFIMRALWFVKTGNFLHTRKELLVHIGKAERDILEHAVEYQNLDCRDSERIDSAFAELVAWSGKILVQQGRAHQDIMR